MKKYALLTALIALCLLCFSQETPPPSGTEMRLPVVVPPSPEAASINMGGQLSVGLVSGGPQASIPLYEIKIPGLTVPVSLDYRSTGTKVDELPSRFGMNWTLSVCGVASRILHGKVDDQSTRQQPYSGFPAYQNALYGYAIDISQSLTGPTGGYDAEPDEFRYDAPGISGKFALKDDGSVLQIPYTNNKIQVIGGPWGGGGQFSAIIITNTEGIKYTFGTVGAIENTTTIQNGQYAGISHAIRTAFFLKKIELPQGDYINFLYNPISFSVTNGKVNKIKHVLGQDPYCPSCACMPGTFDFKEDLSSVAYQTCYLSSIITSRGESVSFGYGSRPDNPNDVRVAGISINAGNFSKSYYLAYDFYNSGTPAYSRYFLKEIGYTIPLESNPQVSDTIRYVMQYESPDALPARLSYAQDHWGYYNGQTANATLLPPYPGQLSNPYSSANREPSFIHAVKGVLKKITFPTGGYQEFEYEGNGFGYWETVNSMVTVMASGSGENEPEGDPNGAQLTVTHYSQVFTPARDQSVQIEFTRNQNPVCNCPPQPENGPMFESFELRNLTTNTVIYSSSANTYGTSLFPAQILAGNQYRLRLNVTGFQNAGRAALNYDTAPAPIIHYIERTAPGVRVKRIGIYDPVSGKTNNKYYKYARLAALNESSGIFLMNATYWEDYISVVKCVSNPMPFDVYCTSRLVSSTPINNLYMFDGQAGGYSSVIESDDTTFANGGIEHKFIGVAAYDMPQTYYGSTILTVPTSTQTAVRNEENETNVFDSNRTIVKQTKYYRHGYPVTNNYYRAIVARQKVNHFEFGMPSSNPSISESYFPFCYDLNGYDFVSSWIKLDSTVETLFANNGTALTSKTTYFYGNQSNTNPIRTETLNSKGDLISEEMIYPTDYYDVPPYIRMVASNIISPAIQTQVKKNNVLVSKTRNEYHDWFPFSSPVVITPEKTYTTTKTNPEELRLHYYSYDDKGNLREVAKENDQRMSYIWDYGGKFPIAEFQNASITTDSLAYSSFEADGTGGWLFAAGGPVFDNTAPTGTQVYDLAAGGAITKTIISTRNYYVSYWLKNGSGSVDVNGVAAQTFFTKNGWTCYRHAITGLSGINITGTGKIDELRLYPQNSLVKTYTYKPFVGVSSECDANNRVTYYEYDNQARLVLVRDENKNILKKICYKLASQSGDCPVNITANGQWTATGQTRCRPCEANPNYLSTIGEKEEIDVNPSSPTYNQHRWVPSSLVYCDSPPDWVNTGDVYCELNSNMENTGNQVVYQRDVNPCSASYNQIRQITLYNPGACPVCNPACTPPSQRCINGACETGNWVVVDVIRTGKNSWICEYAYCFSNGTISSYRQQVAASAPCPIICH